MNNKHTPYRATRGGSHFEAAPHIICAAAALLLHESFTEREREREREREKEKEKE